MQLIDSSHAALMNFNSIKVQLKPFAATNAQLLFRNFNSIKVQLKQNRFLTSELLEAYFNSIKVQLKLLKEFDIMIIRPYFNSIKVQLKHIFRTSNIGMVHRFQFHKGTIKAQKLRFWLYLEPYN